MDKEIYYIHLPDKYYMCIIGGMTTPEIISHLHVLKNLYFSNKITDIMDLYDDIKAYLEKKNYEIVYFSNIYLTEE